MTNYAGYEAQLFYKQESVEGQTPAGQWLSLSQKAGCKLSDNPGHNFTTKSGSVDSAKPTKGVPNPILTIDYKPNLGNGKAFLKNFLSTDNSFSILCVKIDISNFVFYRLTGCKVKRSQASGKLWPKADDVMINQEIWAFNTINTDEGTTPSYESVPDSVLSWSNVTIKAIADPSGTNPSRTTITQWNSFDWTVENDLYRIWDKDGNTVGIRRAERKSSGSLEFIITGNESSSISATQTAAYQDIEFLFSSDSYLFNDAAYESFDLDHTIGNMAIRHMDFRGATLVIS